LEREAKIKAELQEAAGQKADLIKDIEDMRKHKADMLEPALLASTKELKVKFMLPRMPFKIILSIATD
jgi:hypothetical protein